MPLVTGCIGSNVHCGRCCNSDYLSIKVGPFSSRLPELIILFFSGLFIWHFNILTCTWAGSLPSAYKLYDFISAHQPLHTCTSISSVPTTQQLNVTTPLPWFLLPMWQSATALQRKIRVEIVVLAALSWNLHWSVTQLHSVGVPMIIFTAAQPNFTSVLFLFYCSSLEDAKVIVAFMHKVRNVCACATI